MKFLFFYRMARLVASIGIVPFILSGCGSTTSESASLTLSDITYSEGKQESQYCVLISEDGKDTPYLVLTNHYSEKDVCLLLRKEILDTFLRFNPNGRYAGYYEDSEIDQFLNNDYYSGLPDYLRDAILPTEITITDKDSLGVCGKETSVITRKVFLLSATEAGWNSSASSSTILREGSCLSYFSDNVRRVAYTSNGDTTSWWLRTPNTWYDNMVCGINEEGVIGIGGVGGNGEDYKNGVRPAFCINANTVIDEHDGAFYLTASDSF